jgi:hypothetical protein
LLLLLPPTAVAVVVVQVVGKAVPLQALMVPGVLRLSDFKTIGT